MTDKYPGLSSYTDRHGKVRWRYRNKERVVSLPAPDQPGFKEAYQAAVEGRKVPKAPVVRMPGAALPGTFGAATQRLQVSVKWLAHAEATRRKNTRLIDEFLDLRVVPDHPLTWRDVPVRILGVPTSKNFWVDSSPRLTRPSTCWSQFANWSM
ncbi:MULTISPECIES: hypothetical protein [unclassified Mesorhizobium]|uniref:hypothetical protein n=1 Tax=unclassified Mesorhizobium TaxID=325217 RepID=UPI001FDEE979|nr:MULTISPECIES: hypothetical protein [unclassified Mesorhizobium]